MIEIHTLLVYSAWLLMGMLIWFRSDAFVEYMQLFRLDKLFGVREYVKLQKEDFNMNYHMYLMANYNSFFIRLITCPVCLGTWGSIIVGAMVGWNYIPFVFLTVIMGFGLINWGWGNQ